MRLLFRYPEMVPSTLYWAREFRLSDTNINSVNNNLIINKLIEYFLVAKVLRTASLA